MKIKNIAAICKKNKYAVIYERNAAAPTFANTA